MRTESDAWRQINAAPPLMSFPFGERRRQAADDAIGDVVVSKLLEASDRREGSLSRTDEAELAVGEAVAAAKDEPVSPAVNEDAPGEGAVLVIHSIDVDRLVREGCSDDALSQVPSPESPSSTLTNRDAGVEQ